MAGILRPPLASGLALKILCSASVCHAMPGPSAVLLLSDIRSGGRARMCSVVFWFWLGADLEPLFFIAAKR